MHPDPVSQAHAIDLSILADLGLILTVAVGIALLFARFRLPLVLAYVGTGALLGPAGLGLVAKNESLDVLAEVGVVLLLFTVGLELSIDEIRRSWKTVVLAGLIQVGGTTLAAMGVGALAGLPMPTAIAWGFLVSLSSTAVVLRLLENRGELQAAHGRLVVGVLIFQDLCVVPMMLLLPVLGGDGGWSPLVKVLAQAAAIVGFILVAARLVVPRIMQQVAKTRSREMFLLATLAVAGVTAYATSLTGLSLALGAFLAGIVLAGTQYSHQALADVLPIRSLTMCVFFVAIGMLMDPDVIRTRPTEVGAVFLGILLVKFVVMFVAGLVLRFPVRIAALAAAALAQVGEFSFVLATAAGSAGLIPSDQGRIFIAASVLTIALAPLGVSLFPRILAGTRALEPLERLLDGRANPPMSVHPDRSTDHIIVAGLGVGGRTVIAAAERAGIPFVVIELNPETVAEQRSLGRRVVYGDVTSPEVLQHAGIDDARAMVLVVSDATASQMGIAVIRRLRPDLPIVLRTRYASDEGTERAPNTEVLSEEFAGALAMAGSVLRRCGAKDWHDIVEHLAKRHDDDGPAQGPPVRAAATVLARTTTPTQNPEGSPPPDDPYQR